MYSVQLIHLLLFQVCYNQESKLFKFNASVRFRDAIDVIRYRPPSTRFADVQFGKSFHDLGNFK